MSIDPTIRIAVAQATPVFLNREATIEKACRIIAEAGDNGASLVVFPEAFVPAYPDWVWLVPGGNGGLLDELYTELVENSVVIPDDAVRQLCRAAKESNIHVTIGVNERNQETSRASIYNTLLYIGASGDILGKHRKLMPTASERTVWAQGDGSTLDAYNTPFGVLGGLTCWENYMPLARQAMYDQGVQIYVAPTWDQSNEWLASLRHIAKEGGMFVIGCCMPLHYNDIPDHLAFKSLYPQGTEWINAGKSCVIDPRGRVIAGPVEQKETTIYADISLSQLLAPKRMFDVVGHYARPDVFRFEVNRGPSSPAGGR